MYAFEYFCCCAVGGEDDAAAPSLKNIFDLCFIECHFLLCYLIIVIPLPLYCINFVLWKFMHASYMSSVPLFYWLFSFACSRVCLLLVGWMIQMVIQFWFALVMTILFTYMSCHRECLNLSLNQFGWSLFLPMLLFNEIELLCARFMERGRIFSRREVRVIEIGPDGLFFTGDGTGMLSVWKILAKPNAEMSWIIYICIIETVWLTRDLAKLVNKLYIINVKNFGYCIK